MTKLPKLSFRKKNKCFEIHYNSPNKKTRMTSITIPFSDDADYIKAKCIAQCLCLVGAALKDDPTIQTSNPVAPAKKITEKCENDIIMMEAKEKITAFINQLAQDKIAAFNNQLQNEEK